MPITAHLPAKRHGLTLIEVVLVLSLLVIISAVSMPYLDGAFSRAHLSGASDMVRGAWAQARLQAMESGEAQVFRCEPKGSRFQLTSLNKLGMPESSSQAREASDEDRAAQKSNQESESTSDSDSGSSSGSDSEWSPEDILRLGIERLPDDVNFAMAEVSASNQVAAMFGGSTDQSWSDPILFNPDGTTSDASVLLENDRGETIRVTLRGLTGVSSAGQIGNEEVP
ncbi:MAG: prepilin-type N-terminal cleavage/methylation domain-containing protein [Pirellulales bacterium]